MVEKFTALISRVVRDRAGGVAIIFAFVLPILVVLSIGGVDLYRIGVVKQELQEALDAATLMVARSGSANDADADRIGDAAFVEMMKTSDVQAPGSTFKLNADGDVTGTATGQLRPMIMGLFSGGVLNANVETVVKRAVGTPVELVLVLDTTLSMAGKPIADLKTAATNLVDKLHTNAAGANLKIGVVPFSEHVNVGVSRRNEPWLEVAKEYTTKTKVDGYPQKQTKTTCTGQETYACWNDGRLGSCTRRTGCTTVSTGPDKWIPESYNIREWKFRGCVGTPPGPKYLEDKDPTRRYPGPVSPNTTDIRCNSEITTLTANKQTVVNAIGALNAYGMTYIPSGLTWGFNMLSKPQPLTDAAAYDPTGSNLQPRKVLVLMTDGANTRGTRPTPPEYGGYGSIHTSSAPGQIKKANTDTKALCENIRKEDIEIYTVAFLLDDAGAKKLVQDCATPDGAHYFDAANAAELEKAFGEIADALRNLYIAK